MKPPLIKTLHFKFAKQFVWIGAQHVFIMLMVLFGSQTVAAASETADQIIKKNDKENIRITADKLVAQVDTGQIEFVGNVRATQADTVITADRLKIYYNPEIIKKQSRAKQTESIEKIIATGRVKIIYDNIMAETEKAEYLAKSAILILTGDQSKVTRGEHTITGTKFTLHRLDGKLTVESSEEGRVKAIFKGTEKAD